MFLCFSLVFFTLCFFLSFLPNRFVCLLVHFCSFIHFFYLSLSLSLSLSLPLSLSLSLNLFLPLFKLFTIYNYLLFLIYLSHLLFIHFLCLLKDNFIGCKFYAVFFLKYMFYALSKQTLADCQIETFHSF